MKVRNPTGRGMLIPGQRVVPPGPDFHAVKDDENVRALVAAGALEVDGSAGEASAPRGRKASNPDSEENS